MEYIYRISESYSEELAQLIEQFTKYNPAERPDIFSA